MVRILDDGHLESLQCTKCRKYLSIFPVKNHPTRDVSCGRCSRDYDDGVRSTLYELVAEKFLFKCVNRYEGCRELLRADETEAHEKECIGNVYNCPKCIDGTKRSVLELMWHYKLEHHSSCLKQNSFVVKSPKEDVMLYVQNDVVFFVYIYFLSSLNKLYLNAATLTDVKATQSFSVIVGSRFERTERRQCKTVAGLDRDYCSVDWDEGMPLEVIFKFEVSDNGRRHVAPVPAALKSKDKNARLVKRAVLSNEDGASTASISNMKFKVQLPMDFKKKFGYELNDRGTALLHEDGHAVDLTCSNCKKLIGLPLFRCKKLNHQVCETCRAWCGICSCRTVRSDSDMEISSHLKFPCRWNCGGYFSSGLRNHEKSCELRTIKCPNCQIEIKLMSIKIHMSKDHKISINIYKDYDVEQIKEYFHNWGGDIYFVLNDMCYRITGVGSGPEIYLKFSSLVESNRKLELVRNESVIQICSIKIRLQDLDLYTPYINFNHK